MSRPIAPEVLAAINELQDVGCEDEELVRLLTEALYGLHDGYKSYHLVCVNTDMVPSDSLSDWRTGFEREMGSDDFQ